MTSGRCVKHRQRTVSPTRVTSAGTGMLFQRNLPAILELYRVAPALFVKISVIVVFIIILNVVLEAPFAIAIGT